jgi:hypothetical protein
MLGALWFGFWDEWSLPLVISHPVSAMVSIPSLSGAAIVPNALRAGASVKVVGAGGEVIEELVGGAELP